MGIGAAPDAGRFQGVAVMKRLAGLFLALFIVACGGPSDVPPETAPNATVEVIETWPEGESLDLSPQQSYFLRLRYGTDAPVRIWARPYFEGNEVPTGTHGSPLHEGSGETSGWFWLERPWRRVDEVRISISGGGRHSTEVLRHRVHIVADPDASAAGPEPA